MVGVAKRQNQSGTFLVSETRAVRTPQGSLFVVSLRVLSVFLRRFKVQASGFRGPAGHFTKKRGTPF